MIFARLASCEELGGLDIFEAQLGERGRQGSGESGCRRDGSEIGDTVFLAEQVDNARSDRLDRVMVKILERSECAKFYDGLQ